MDALRRMGLLLAMLVLAACTASVAQPAVPADLIFVIPAGTVAARMRGETVATIPERMTVTAGQSVVVRNEDSAMHYFFYAPIAPGQTYRQTFSQPGRYGYSGFLSCSVADFDSIAVEVIPAVAGRAPTSGG